MVNPQPESGRVAGHPGLPVRWTGPAGIMGFSAAYAVLWYLMRPGGEAVPGYLGQTLWWRVHPALFHSVGPDQYASAGGAHLRWH